MCEETRDYYTFFATNTDSLAPKYNAAAAAATVPPPAVEQGPGDREEEGTGEGQQAEAIATGGPAGAQAGAGVTSRTGPLPHPGAPQEGSVAAVPQRARGGAGTGQHGEAGAGAREQARREKLVLQASVQEDLHRQRVQMDQARMGIAQRRSQAEEQLRRERERLATRAWWRRPTSLPTSSWVRTGGARATTTPTGTAPATTWPSIDTSMLANAGDTTHTAMEEQQEPEETRIVRMVDLSRDNLAGETIEIEMEVDEARAMDSDEENRERNVVMGKGRGNGRGGRFRDN